MLVFYNIQLSAQQGNFGFACHVLVDSTETMAKAGCQTSNCNYDYDDFIDIFMVNENTPIKTIRIKFYIVHYSETDPRNFELSNPVHLAFLEETVAFNENIISNMYIETAADCQEHQCHVDGFTHNVTDAKIRFAVDYEEVVDATLWNADPYSMGAYKNALKTNFLTGDNTHVAYFLTGSQCLYEKFVLQNNETCNQPWGSFSTLSQWIQYTVLPLHYTNFDGHSAIVAPAVYAKYAAQNNGYFCDEEDPELSECCPLECPESWQLGSGIVHELGHVIGLDHTIQKPNISPAEFYCPTNIMHPAAYRRYLNDVQIAQLHRGISQKNVRNAVVNCESSDQNLEINRDHTWNYSTKMYQNILVKAPYTLTITCELQMINNGKIFVEPGARLVVDGGVITKGCDEFWGGIEVWGNSHLNQYNPANQGKVELKNGAVIEYAKDAISLMKFLDINTTGGIVISKDSYFRNNKRAVMFMKYENFLGSQNTVRDNHSTFTNTTFIVDDDFMEGQNFNAHVTMWDVRGVKFYGCRFINDMSDGLFDNSHNKGIFSIDAGYIIASYCDAPDLTPYPCPTQYQIHTEFTGFSYGVHATSSSTSKTLSLDQAAFEENYLGVVVSQQNGFRVIRSSFLVGNNDLVDNEGRDQKGVYSLENTRFTIEDNFFEGAQIGNPSKGLSIRNAKEAITRSYNNDFEHLYVGQHLVGYNRDRNDPYLGYQTVCNRHHNNQEAEHQHDILIQGDFEPNWDGVHQHQGSSQPPVSFSNTFSHTGTNPNSDVENLTNHSTTFFHTGGNNEPVYRNTMVDVQYTDQYISCPSNFSGKDVEHEILSFAERGVLLDLYDDSELELAQLLYNYEQLIDGGSTSDLVEQIQNTWPQEAWDLHEDLMDRSPFLSTEVMIETAEHDILPVALYFEICLANPDLARNDNFLYYIEYDAPSPLPAYMVDILRENRDSITLKTLMELELSHQFTGMTQIANQLLTDYQLDTIRDLDAIRYWISRPNRLYDRYSVLESAIEENDFTMALNVYNALSNDFDLSDQQLDEYDHLLDYITFRQSLYLDNRTIAELDSMELVVLESMAISNTGRSQNFAANILCFFYENCSYIYTNPAQHSQRPQNNTTETSHINYKNDVVSVYPNPANTFVTFSWEFESDFVQASLYLYNINGLEVKSKNLLDAQGQWVLDTRQLPAGVYFYNVLAEKELVAAGRFTVQK